jgi:membrane protease subunit HflK
VSHAGTNWRTLFLALAGCALLVWLATGVFFVRTNEQAVVRRFGRMQPAVRTPGLHLGLPVGLDRVDRLWVQETKRVAVGIDLTGRTLGRQAEPRQAECLTGDLNLIIVSAVVQYRIAEPKAYVSNVADVAGLVQRVAASELSRIVAGMGVDDILTVKRNAIQIEAREAVQAALDSYEAGVILTRPIALSNEGVRPPAEVADAFHDVTRAREDKQRAINVARGYANRILPEARGGAYRMESDAEAYAQEVEQTAWGDAERFVKEAAELKKNRDLTLRRLILEAMEEILPRLRKVVVDPRTGETLDLGLIETEE